MIPRQKTAEMERTNPDERKERISRFVELYSIHSIGQPRPERILTGGEG